MNAQDDARRMLRNAEAALSERPSPRVRQAVMRAATAAADAAHRRQLEAQKSRPGIGSRWSRAGWFAPIWRWSAPVAASVLVGAIAVELVSQMHQAVPTAGSSALPQREDKARPDSVATPSAGAPPVAVDRGTVDRAAAASPAPRAKAVEHPASRKAEPQAAEVERFKANAAPSADRDAAAVQESRQISVPLDVSPAQAQAPAPAAAERARSAAAPAAQAAAPPPQLDSKAWIERIVALRRQGRQREADQELERLRRAYPGLSIPPEALR
jgi:hypothetical protein